MWGPWATVGFGLIVATAFLATQVIVLIVMIIVKVVTDPKLDTTQYVESLETNGWVLALSTCASTAVCLPVIALIIIFRKGATIKEYVALNSVSAKTLLRLTVLITGFIAISAGVTTLLRRPLVPEVMIEVYTTMGWPPVLWFALIIAAPVFEEIFFRGFLFEGFRQSHLGNTGAMILTSLFWAVIHLQYGTYEITTIFVSGILLCVVRIRTGSLWSCIFMHSVMNFVATVEVELHVRNLLGS